MTPQLVFLIFGLVVLIGAVFKPNGTRLFVGFFFLLMALGVNLTMLLTDPNLYIMAGSAALLPVYRWFFTQVLAIAPVPFVIALIVFEISVGVSILSRGKWVKYGLIAGALFSIGMAPLGIESVTTPVLGLAIALLLRKQYPHSLVDILGKRRRQEAAVS
jgi:hypothetical protein